MEGKERKIRQPVTVMLEISSISIRCERRGENQTANRRAAIICYSLSEYGQRGKGGAPMPIELFMIATMFNPVIPLRSMRMATRKRGKGKKRSFFDFKMFPFPTPARLLSCGSLPGFTFSSAAISRTILAQRKGEEKKKKSSLLLRSKDTALRTPPKFWLSPPLVFPFRVRCDSLEGKERREGESPLISPVRCSR